jgi:glycosyltransferase involved in cell wall biosynthesis
MKIGVNIFPLRPRIAGGHEFYVRNLIDTLLRKDDGNYYYIITSPWNHNEIDFVKGPCRKICIEAQPSRFGPIRKLRATLKRGHWDLYRCAMELGVDVWFCPMMDLQPRNIDIPSVVTIADIQHEYYPQFFTQEELRHRVLTYKASCQLSTAVIAISDHCRNSLLDRYQLPADKVRRIYMAANPIYNVRAAMEAWPAISSQYGLDRGYLFYPANTWPHKNHEILFIALNLLKKRGISPALVLTGAHIADFDRLKDLARQFGIENSIRHLGYVEPRLFPGLYHGASCLVFPSLFEGFGFPLVEAMSCGCPVACSNICSIPEVVGNAALQFDPRNPDSIADSIERLLVEDDLRRQLIAEGRRQATLFNWEKAAEETLALFESVRGQVRRREYGPPQDVVEGYFADGWAGPEILLRRVELARWRTLVLEGEISGNCSPIDIRIMADREKLGELHIKKPGPFSHRLDLPESCTTPLVDIKIAAGRHFVPRKLGGAADSRRLSYKLRKFELLDTKGVALSFRGK